MDIKNCLETNNMIFVGLIQPDIALMNTVHAAQAQDQCGHTNTVFVWNQYRSKFAKNLTNLGLMLFLVVC